MESHANAAAAATHGSSLQIGHSAAAKNSAYTRIKVEKHTFDWTIYNFGFCWVKTGRYLQSPIFPTGADGKYKWRLRVYPKGESQEYKEYLSVYLNLATAGLTSVLAGSKISILNATEEKYIRSETTADYYSEENDSWGFPDYIALRVLRAEAFDLLPEGNLTISCEVSIGVSKTSGYSTVAQIEEPKCTLSQDFESLCVTEQFSDVILSVDGIDGKDWPAHKAILSARSPVFAAMFAHQMIEWQENRVDIMDIDSEVVGEMLTYIYTGKSPNIDKMASDLLKAADKYDLSGLKVKCERVLCSSLTTENASDILKLADAYNAEQLKTRVSRFIDTHLKK